MSVENIQVAAYASDSDELGKRDAVNDCFRVARIGVQVCARRRGFGIGLGGDRVVVFYFNGNVEEITFSSWLGASVLDMRITD